MTRLIVAAAIVAAALLPGALGTARAQFVLSSDFQGARGDENIEGFTVSGKASVYAKPNRLEIDLKVASASELTADAIVKYRDAKRRVGDAFDDLKLDGVSIDERGLLVDQKGMVQNPYYFDAQPNQRTKAEVQLSRKLVVRCDAIREMDEDELLQLVARLLDVAQDAGGIVGDQSTMDPYSYSYNRGREVNLVRFILDDFDALQEQAYEEAVADARARAERLARLSGVELGPIVAIREIAVPGDPGGQSRSPMYGAEEPSRGRQLESTRFQDVPIRVELLVRFRVRTEADDEKDAEGETP